MINPTAFRLGWKANWLDNAYIDLKYYPEYIHYILKLRFLINCFLFYLGHKKEFINRTIYLFSHFTITNNISGISINIYYYDGPLYTAWYSMLDGIAQDQLAPTHWRTTKSKIYRKINYDENKNFFIFLIYYYWFINNNNNNDIPYKIWYSRHNLFKYNKWDSGIYYSNSAVLNMALYTKFINKLISIYRKQWYKPIVTKFSAINYEEIGKNLFIAAYTISISKPILYTIKNYLIYLLYYINNKKDVNYNVNFFLIDNDMITARFLSKYICARLQQEYPVKSVILPLRRELLTVRKQLPNITNLLSNTNLGYKIKMPLINKNYFSLKHIYNNEIANKIIKKNYITYNMFKIFFYKLDYNIKYYCLSIILDKQFLITNYLKNLKTYLNNMDISYNHYNDINLEANYNYYNNLLKKSHINLGIVHTSNFNFKKLFLLTEANIIQYLNFSINKYTIKKYHKILNLNKKQLRDKKPDIFLGLKGFKFQLRGRFTRKQIAAKFNFVVGSIPLSSMKANIDYSFATIPVRNSAIGIKVWLYKDNNNSEYLLKTI